MKKCKECKESALSQMPVMLRPYPCKPCIDCLVGMVADTEQLRLFDLGALEPAIREFIEEGKWYKAEFYFREDDSRYSYHDMAVFEVEEVADGLPN